jgi:hypothetical protein
VVGVTASPSELATFVSSIIESGIEAEEMDAGWAKLGALG